jgi:hypothetical protein
MSGDAPRAAEMNKWGQTVRKEALLLDRLY